MGQRDSISNLSFGQVVIPIQMRQLESSPWPRLLFVPCTNPKRPKCIDARKYFHHLTCRKQLNCNLHAGLSPCRKPQKCRLWTSTQSRNCPSKRTREQESKPKTTQQKQEKHTTKTKTKQKRQREVGSQPAMGITCMMTSYVSF